MILAYVTDMHIFKYFLLFLNHIRWFIFEIKNVRFRKWKKTIEKLYVNILWLVIWNKSTIDIFKDLPLLDLLWRACTACKYFYNLH